MPAVRIIPPHEPRGLYALTAALALILGPLAGLAVLRRTIPIPSSSPWNELITVFLIPALFITAFATRCQRRRPVFLTALLFGFCFWLSFIVAQDLAQPTSGGAQILSGVWVGFLLAASIIAIITALAALFLRWFTRFLLVIYVEQTGRLCPRCAYPIDPAAQPVCPECGRAIGGATSRDSRTTRSLRAFRRHGRLALVLILLIEGLVAARVIILQGYPIHRFQSALSPGEDHKPATPITGRRPDGTTVQVLAAGAWIPFAGSPTRGVIVGYLPGDQPHLPSMQICVYDRPSASSFTSVYPVILCSLDRVRAEAVIRSGLPPRLLDAMRDAAEGAPVAGQSQIEVDPAPFFPT